MTSTSSVTRAYSSSLTDAEWKLLERLLPEILPPKQQTRPLEWSYREMIDSILYRLKNGCHWANLPKDLPPIRRCIGTTRSGAPTVPWSG
ncbi:MAG: transposase [Leptolyngbyaceae cyanobacterium T60_A2020_046]|nr:transposase [Leptolyngbyaceae cyanobacterium T60_A2020_046]